MRRIALMVFRCFLKAPWWWFRIWRFGRPGDSHTEQERYDYLRYVVKKANHAGRVDVISSGVENLPKDNGFILFPNHQGMFDMLAIIETCPNPVSVVVKKEAAGFRLLRWNYSQTYSPARPSSRWHPYPELHKTGHRYGNVSPLSSALLSRLHCTAWWIPGRLLRRSPPPLRRCCKQQRLYIPLPRSALLPGH